jgi:flagellar biosynthesis protein FlhB
MNTVLKLVLFFLFLYFMINGFYRLYRFLNKRIMQSPSPLGVLGFTLLLIVVNVLLFCAGLVVFLKVYEFFLLPT